MKLKIPFALLAILYSTVSMAVKPAQTILDDLLKEINSQPLINNIRILKKFNKFILMSATPTNVSFTPSSENSNTGFALFARDITKPVFYNTVPLATELQQPVKLFGAKKSVAHAFLGIYPLQSKQNIKVTVSPLKNSQGRVFPTNALKLYKIKHLFKTVSQYVYTPVPMGLQPIDNSDKINLRQDISESIFIQATIPANIAAGTYYGIIKVGKLQKIIELNIYNFQLQQVPRERMNWGFYSSDRVKSRDFKFMAEHGCNTVVITPGLDEKFTQRLKTIRQAGIDGVLLIDVGALDKNILFKRYSQPWRKAYMAKVSKFAAVMRGNTETNGFIGMIHDEPRENNLNPWNRTYKQMMIYHDLIGQAAPEIKRAVNPMFDEITQKYPQGLYTRFTQTFAMVMPHYWAKCKNIIAAANANPNCSLWSYNDGDNRLAWGLHSWKVGIHGRTQYHYRPYSNHEHPLSPIFMGNSEYEGRSFTGNYVIAWADKLWSTLKFRAMQNGIIDYHYLYTLELLIKHKPNSRVARTAKEYLTRLKNRIPKYAHAANFVDATEAGTGEVKTSMNLTKIRATIANFCEQLNK